MSIAEILVERPFYIEKVFPRGPEGPSPYIEARVYGAAPESADNQAAINAALAAANAVSTISASGRARVLLGVGTFVLSSGHPLNTGSCIVMPDNVVLEGAGIGSTTLYLADAAEKHMILFPSPTSNAGLRNLTIDGNGLEQLTGVHCIRMGSAGTDACADCFIENCEICHGHHYGIGAQEGSFDRCRFSNLYMHHFGNDAIDFKNHNDDNYQIIFDNLWIEDVGGKDVDSTGIDLRCQAIVSNYTYRGSLSSGNTGIRFRGHPEETPDRGLGSQWSSLTNFYIENTDPTPGGIGVDVSGNFNRVSNGVIRNCSIGLWASYGNGFLTGPAQGGSANTITLSTTASSVDDFYNGDEILIFLGTGLHQFRTISDYDGTTKVATVSVAWTTPPDATSHFTIGPSGKKSGISNVSAVGCSNGFHIASVGAQFSNCNAIASTGKGFYITFDQNILSNCASFDSGDTGFYLEALASSNSLNNCFGVGSATLELSDGGTNTEVIDGNLPQRLRYIEQSSQLSMSLLQSRQNSIYTGTGNTMRVFTFNSPPNKGYLTPRFVVTDSHGIRIVPSSGVSLNLGGSVGSVKAESTTIGSTLRLLGVSQTQWVAIELTGTWTVT